MKTVADQFAETLVAAGVKRVYGIVGDSLNGLTDAIRRQDKIEWVHVRHEEVAALRRVPRRISRVSSRSAPAVAGRAISTSSMASGGELIDLAKSALWR
jgi:glyoxylate carboligase